MTCPTESEARKVIEKILACANQKPNWFRLTRNESKRVTEPKKTIIFVILILAIQQFDGNFLGPKILGNSLKLPTFWIMFSIFLCGGLFGVVGMIIGIPLFAVLCVNMQEFIKTRNYSSNRITEGELERLGFNDEKSSHQKTHVKKPFIKKERKK